MTPQDMARLRWSRTSAAERAAHSQLMVRARMKRLTGKRRREIARLAGLASAARRAEERTSVDSPNE